jgi:26S proteasome regulatory subunit N2
MTTSAAGMLAMLDSSDARVRGAALERLYPVVDVHWVEIQESLLSIEEMSEDDSFSHRALASAVASKCFYHMEDYNDALRHALSSDKYFDTSMKSQYVDTMLSCCIDRYISSRQEKNRAEDPGGDTKDAKGDAAKGDDDDDDFGEEFASQLETIVEAMFKRCFDDGSYEQALGIALEARRVDMVRASIQQSGSGKSGMLVHAFDLCQSVVSSRTWRREVLTVLVDIYKENDTNDDYVSLCNCLQALDDAAAVSVLLDGLLRSAEESKYLLAYQVAFDLCENENQKFAMDISAGLPKDPFAKTATVAATASAPATAAPDTEGALSEEQMMANIEASRAALATETDGAVETAATDTQQAEDAPFPEGDAYWSKLRTLRSILVGGLSVRLYLQFLYKNNRADLILLGTIKDKLPERNSVCHGACVTAHSYMHCGTTVDTFLRKNLEWLSKASNWVSIYFF